jgi:TolB-like protein/DNA-binding winged helix-turn-helix (wHTH) protein/Tfp pilus assembly protein PilF
MLNTRFRVGNWLADPELDEIRRGEELIKLEPRAMRVLVHLAQRPGVVVSADELLDAVWPGLVVGPNSVYQAIALLRRVFGDDSDSPAYIATVPRKGYRLIAEVKPASELRAAKPAIEAANASPAADPVSASTSPRRFVWRAAIAATVVAVTGLWFWIGRPAPATALSPSVAVLPFSDLSSEKNNQAFCDGLTEELINSLGRVEQLRVIARTSAFSFRDQPADARAIGGKLGVTHLVEGSVRRNGGRIRISAHLINVSTGYQEWAESFDRPFEDVLQVQEGISQAVTRALEVRLAGTRVAVNLPKASAYELYLLGRFQQMERQPESIRRAMEYHRAAIEQDPTFALAYAGLANSYMFGYWYGNFPLDQSVAGVRENVAKALAANPELAEAYVARGRMYLESFDLAAAEEDFKRAQALNANLSDAFIGLGMVYEYRGQPGEALVPLEHAAQLDPLHPVLHGRRCQAFQNLGRYAEAERACRRVIEIQPSIVNGYWGLALIDFAKGNTDAAVRGYLKALEKSPERIDLRSQIATLYLDLGKPQEAAAAYPTVARTHADYNPIELQRARWWIAKSDVKGLATHLDQLPLQASVNAGDLLDAAMLELVAGKPRVAQALAQRVTSEPGFNLTRQIENPWLARWGNSDGVALALVARSAGDRVNAEKYLQLTSEFLDRLQRHDFRAHGVEYVRARVFALRGQSGEALEALRKARDAGWRSAWWMRADPALASLREQPAFVELVNAIDAGQRITRSAHTPSL